MFYSSRLASLASQNGVAWLEWGAQTAVFIFLLILFIAYFLRI